MLSVARNPSLRSVDQSLPSLFPEDSFETPTYSTVVSQVLL
jgi:hypothetical protein